MLDVSRTVRFFVNLDQASAVEAAARRHNTFAGWPTMCGLGAYYELMVTCTGTPDPSTGYLLDVAAIDRAVRDRAIPIVERAVRDHPGRDAGAVLQEIVASLEDGLPRPARTIRWQLSPYYSVAMDLQDTDRVTIRQQFEFAAAHRLHVASLDDAANQRIFGKCNAPNYHGHNYRLTVAVSTDLGDDGRTELSLLDLEGIVARTVIDRYDHTNLNLDTEEFRELNPSVEHITKVCYDLLAGPVAEAGGRLEHVTVWETEKTCCTYPTSLPGG
ncbi:MAG: 6-pyruvoyl trahydropterin synthase family protein [Planctomycetota bacterium]|jgi:6-pyruvoyltetrahydropterin/6-carboxytetrahydropterin synthase